MQEANCLLCGKLMLCCSGWGNPPPPHSDLRPDLHGGNPGYPPCPGLGSDQDAEYLGYPHTDLAWGTTPILIWDGGTPTLTWDGGTPPSPIGKDEMWTDRLR